MTQKTTSGASSYRGESSTSRSPQLLPNKIPQLSKLLAMSSPETTPLNLTVEEFLEDCYVEKELCIDKRAFPILNDYIQPDSKTSLATASAAIIDFLPDDLKRSDPKEHSIMSLAELCVKLAEQIPYSHPGQLRLVHLLQQVAKSPKAATRVSNRDIPLRIFGQVLIDQVLHVEWWPEEAASWINGHSFVAKFDAIAWDDEQLNWSLQALKDGLEEAHDMTVREKEAKVTVAAQYMQYRGQDIVQHIHCPPSATGNGAHVFGLLTESRYKGPPTLNLGRWMFWRDEFAAAGANEGASQELKSVAGRTVALMDSLVAANSGLAQ